MKSISFTFLLLSISITATAQSEKDSSDIYFQHLNLPEIIVSSPVGQVKRKYSPTPISVVTKKALHQTASTNIVDAIAKQPGLAQITTGSGISKPVIRGLGYNRIVTVADGVRQEGQQWGDEHGIELDGAGIGQVEVLKGPASLMYGSDAMAGVVIFHPEAIEPEGQMNANVSMEYQSNSGLFDYSVRFGGNQKGIVWNGRYSEKFAHAYQNKYDGYVPGTQFHERAAQGLVGVNRDWGFSHLTLSYYHLTPSMTEGERDEMTGDLLCNGNVKSYQKALPYQQIHHYKAVLDNSFTVANGMIKAIVGYQQNRRQEYEDSTDPSLDFLLHTFTYDLRYMMSEHDGWRMTGGIGGMGQRSQNEGEEYLIPAYNLWDIGAYATGSKTLNRWTLSGGLRFDNRYLHSLPLWEDSEERFTDFTRNFNALTGSIGAVFNANSYFNLRANIARGFRAPNLSELGSNGVHEGTLRYEIGNPDLSPEHSWQTDLGIDYNNRHLSIEFALFLNRISNYIFAEALPMTSTSSESDSYRRFHYTQGDALLKGFEASIDVHPVHQLHLGATFSMVDARQLHQPIESRYLPLVPPARLTGEVKWEFTHNGDHHARTPHHLHESEPHHRLDHILDNAFISFNIEHNFKQDHYYSLDDTETATPAYTLLNLSFGSDILLKNGHKLCELCLIADNLLDCAYQNHLSRLKYANINNVTGRRGIFNPGRNITMKVTFPVKM